MSDTIIHDPHTRARIRRIIVSMRMAGHRDHAIHTALASIHRDAGIPPHIADRYAREDLRGTIRPLATEDVHMLIRDGIETLVGLYELCEDPSETIAVARELRQYLATTTAIGLANKPTEGRTSLTDIADLLRGED